MSTQPHKSAEKWEDHKHYYAFKNSDVMKRLTQAEWAGNPLCVRGRPRWYPTARIVVHYKDSYWTKLPQHDMYQVIKECDYANLAGSTGTKLCLIGPIYATIPNIDYMTICNSKGLHDIMKFQVPSDPQSYGECRAKVYVLAGWNRDTEKFVELKQVTTYPAACHLRNTRDNPSKPGTNAPDFKDGMDVVPGRNDVQMRPPPETQTPRRRSDYAARNSQEVSPGRQILNPGGSSVPRADKDYMTKRQRLRRKLWPSRKQQAAAGLVHFGRPSLYKRT